MTAAPSAGAQTPAPTLEAACERWADRPALTHAGRTLTYADLWRRVLALAWSYRSLGVEPGDRVICALPVCPEHFVALGAAWACGAVHVGAHPDLTGPELLALADRVGARAVVARSADRVADVRRGRPAALRIAETDVRPGTHRLGELVSRPTDATAPPEPDGPDDAALLVLTSGTTGRPKAVIETLPGLWGKVRLFAGALSAGPGDVHLASLPICHVYGLKLALTALTTGGRLVLQERFSPAAALELIGDERVTVLHGTPAHLTLLLRHLDTERHRLETLRWVTSAAAPLRPALVEEAYERLGVEILHVYGCSEGFLTVTTDREDIRLGSAGRTVYRGPNGTPPDGSLAILDPEGGERLPAGRVGEVAFGAALPVRYWAEPPAALDGWYRTGDLGRLDVHGRLYVCGRLEDVVNRGGIKVACAEVDAALARHPGLADAAVIPVDDPVLGEAICACVVPVDGELPPLAGVRDFLAAGLARHKLPDEVRVVASIPRSPAGKLDRAALTAVAADPSLPRQRLRPLT